MNSPSVFSRTRRRVAALVSALAFTFSLASAQVVPVPATPVVGSSNPATAEPPVPRPATSPCIVTLLSNQEFPDYSPKLMNYTPPAACKGPWAKVVLTVDFTVTAGLQYDRTASLYLANTNIFYGTTAEPRSALSPSWHVERDVTDLSALFNAPQTGDAIVYNIFNSMYTGDIFGTATLYFYPTDINTPAPVVPDAVFPVSGSDSPYELDTTASVVTATVKAPLNTEKAYLDVIVQSQQADEFWYFCVPNDVTGPLYSCGNTAFRETEVTIDGKPAGVAPVYPWIFTGGIDPYLWEPITGVQTLNFKPYRVDLTPFAGILADGESHTVGVSVFNADSYFLATANLLVYTDHGSKFTGGGLIENNLTGPTNLPVEHLVTDSSGNTTGTVSDYSSRKFTIKGYVNTSHGRVETTLTQKVSFDSEQTFAVSNNDYQKTVQTSTVKSTTTVKNGLVIDVTDSEIQFPLTVEYNYAVNSDGTSYQAVTSSQKDIENVVKSRNGLLTYSSTSTEHVKSQDTLDFDATGALTAVGPTKSFATYDSSDSTGQCYSRGLISKDRVLTSVQDGCTKPQ